MVSVAQSLTGSVSSLQGAIRQGYLICASSNDVEVLRNRYVGILLHEVRASQLLDSIDDGACDASIMQLEWLAVAQGGQSHCNKLAVGQPVLKIAKGMPLYDHSSVYPSLKYYLQQDTNGGNMEKYIEQHQPSSRCSVTDASTGSLSLNAEELLGTFFIVILFTLAGVITTIVAKGAGRDAKAQDEAEVEVGAEAEVRAKWADAQAAAKASRVEVQLIPQGVQSPAMIDA